MRLPTVITIDGPAASGKSTLGMLLAQKLSYVYFDTGVLYRALTVLALHRGIALDDPEALAHLARTTHLAVLPPVADSGYPYAVLADGEDLTGYLRDVIVDRNVSTVSAYPAVRLALREQQRAIGSRGNVVLVGRDIGSVVMPDAGLKIYLDAPLEERARRRHAELCLRDSTLSLETVVEDLQRRDALDQQNTLIPEDAVTLTTAIFTPQDELEHILRLIDQDTALGPFQATRMDTTSST